LLAYGCNFVVVIVDPVAVQHVQCLNKHKAAVSRVRWQNNRKCSSLTNPNRMLLASSDLQGTILVWDAHSIQPVSAFQDGNKPILGLEWVPHYDETENYVAALHPPYSLVIWDALSGNKVWKKSYTESLIAMDFDPFSANRMACKYEHLMKTR
jgi:WD40 repeat protein